ncbi:unnamed protein product [marine sediment metagenome]|uniref:Uncharacterized protein n=1 Tax=marine sediment metagenome TaxID=412755 RepID=X1DPV1_9ZZZZ
MGRGTARSWINIEGSKEYGEFNKKELTCIRKHFGFIRGISSLSPEEQRYILKKLG